jgi:hypothetical protein
MILAMFLASTLSASAQHRMSIEEMFKLIDKNNTSIQAGKTSVDAAQEGIFLGLLRLSSLQSTRRPSK